MSMYVSTRTYREWEPQAPAPGHSQSNSLAGCRGWQLVAARPRLGMTRSGVRNAR